MSKTIFCKNKNVPTGFIIMAFYGNHSDISLYTSELICISLRVIKLSEHALNRCHFNGDKFADNSV